MTGAVSRRSFLAGTTLLAVGAGRTETGGDLAAIKKILTRPEPAVWVFTGDSITHGALHTLGWRSYPEHFAERVRWELRRMRDVVVNTGISGDITDRLLADLQWRVLQFRPAVVSVMEGMNDCSRGPANRDKFRANLVAIIEKVRGAGGIPLLNTTNTILGGRGDLSAYNDVIRKVATDQKTVLVDHFAWWQKERPTPEKLNAWIEDRTLHPNVYGHRAFAHRIFRELGIFDQNSPTCRLETA
jgi:lysophospholipase L1-like esterase